MSHSALPVQTYTPYQLAAVPHKESLLNEYRGKPLNALRTPAVVIDRSIFAENCAKMHNNAKEWGASFRAHVKTHKVRTCGYMFARSTFHPIVQTAEGTRMQLISSTDRTHAIVVSTLMEAWEVVRAGLVADGTVEDVGQNSLHVLRLSPNRMVRSYTDCL